MSTTLQYRKQKQIYMYKIIRTYKRRPPLKIYLMMQTSTMYPVVSAAKPNRHLPLMLAHWSRWYPTCCTPPHHIP